MAPYGASQLLRLRQTWLSNEGFSSCSPGGNGGRAEGEIQTARRHARADRADGATHLSTLPMNTVMKLRMCSRLSAELSKISSANRRRKIKKSPMFSTKNSEKIGRYALAQVVSQQIQHNGDILSETSLLECRICFVTWLLRLLTSCGFHK